MLVWIQAITRWAEEPVWRMEMLGWIRVMPRWAEDFMQVRVQWRD